MVNPPISIAHRGKPSKLSATEHQHQAALISWANKSTSVYPELRWLFAVPNAAKRSYRLAAMLKAEGMRSGVPDLILPVKSGRYIGLAIEMKTDRGAVSGAQQEWLDGLNSLGWKAIVCRGWEQARQAIIDYLKADYDGRAVINY